MDDIKIFAGNSNLPLAQSIACKLGEKLGKLTADSFSDAEARVEIDEPVRDKDCYVIQSFSAPANDYIMEMMFIIDALRRSQARRVVAVIPYFGYARQERRPKYRRTPISAKVIARMLESVGADQVITVDIHALAIQGFFEIPFTNISATVEFGGELWRKTAGVNSNLMVVSPDVGGVERARTTGEQISRDMDLAIVDKRRPKDNVSEVMHVVGDVSGMDCVIIDDLIDTAGTLCKAALALKEHGANSVEAYATHAVLSGNAYENLATSVLDRVVVTNTIQKEGTLCHSGGCFINIPNRPELIKVIKIDQLLAETIRRVASGESVSQIYMDG